MQDGTLYREYFLVPQAAFYLPEDTKSRFKDKVKRENAITKVDSLLQDVPNLVRIMQYQV